MNGKSGGATNGSFDKCAFEAGTYKADLKTKRKQSRHIVAPATSREE